MNVNKLWSGLLILMICFPMAGCGKPTRDPSKVPIEKYAIVRDQFLRLRPGMTPSQVRAVMGPPHQSKIVSDVWYPDKNNRVNQLKVIYSGGKAVRATWLNLKEKIHFIHFG